jgi:hypothetical protein
MKQVVFLSRILPEPGTPAELPSATSSSLLSKIRAARTRHSACGVSSLLVRQEDCLLGTLEGSPIYVDRMLASLAKEGLLDDLQVLADQPIQHREYSEVALSLIEVEALAPAPAWTGQDIATMDLRTASMPNLPASPT